MRGVAVKCIDIAQNSDCEGSIPALNAVEPLKLARSSMCEEGGMRGVAVKCIDITQNPDREGSLPGRD